MPSGSSGFNCARRCGSVGDELRGALDHSRDVRAGSVLAEPRAAGVGANRLSSKFFFSNQPSRDPLGDSAAAHAARARRDDLPADALGQRRARVSLGPGERIARRLLPQPQRQRGGAVLHERGIRHSESVCRSGAGPLTDHDRRRRCRRRAAVRHAGRWDAHLRSSDDVDRRQHAFARARQPFVARRRRASPKLPGRRSAGNTEPPPQLRLMDGLHDRRLRKSGRSQSRAADCGYGSQQGLDRSQLSDDRLELVRRRRLEADIESHAERRRAPRFLRVSVRAERVPCAL